MIFNAAAKAELQALVEALEPTPDTNPLQAQLDAANEQIEALTEQLASRTDDLAAANAKIEAARLALAP